jgi:hypothetical protein
MAVTETTDLTEALAQTLPMIDRHLADGDAPLKRSLPVMVVVVVTVTAMVMMMVMVSR